MTALPYVSTHAGKQFFFAHPAKSEIRLGDIAHSLSQICRFTGHTDQFYSVAQHSVLTSYLVDPQHALHALMHDAAEAYVGDVSMPLKTLLPDYKEIEKSVEKAIFAHFGLPEQIPEDIKHADLVMLATEKRDLMPNATEDWAILDNIVPMGRKIHPLRSHQAKTLFLERFVELSHETTAREAV